MSKLKIKNRYGITPNHILNDKNLSMKAKGLFGYIQSKPEDWDFSVQRIELQTKDGRDSISAGLKELEDIGYLKRVKYKDGEGKWDWEYHLTDIPFTENPSTVFPFTGNPQIYSNKELVIKNSKKEADQWANIDRKYRRDLNDFVPLCFSCHTKYDKKSNEVRFFQAHLQAEAKKR